MFTFLPLTMTNFHTNSKPLFIPVCVEFLKITSYCLLLLYKDPPNFKFLGSVV